MAISAIGMWVMIVGAGGGGLYGIAKLLISWGARMERWDSATTANVKSIPEKLDIIIALLQPKERRTENTSSPISLTEIGQSIAENVNARNLAKKYAAKLITPDMKNAYDIQEACLQFSKHDLPDMLNDDEKDVIKTEAFDRGMDVSRIYRVIGLAIRDAILEKKGLSHAQIDEDENSGAS